MIAAESVFECLASSDMTPVSETFEIIDEEEIKEVLSHKEAMENRGFTMNCTKLEIVMKVSQCIAYSQD